MIRRIFLGGLTLVAFCGWGCSGDDGPTADVNTAPDAVADAVPDTAPADLSVDVGTPPPDLSQPDVAPSDPGPADTVVVPEDNGPPPPNLAALCVNSGESSGPGLQLLEAAPSTEVVNPMSGAKLPVFVIAPSSGSGPWPVVVVVPGGTGAAAQVANRAGPLVSAGVVTVLPGSWFQRPRPYVRRRAHPLFNFSCLGLN